MDPGIFAESGRKHEFSDRPWDVIVIVASGLILVITLYCLATGITTVFMHLYYFPIIYLAYRYLLKGVLYSVGLSLLYFVMVVYFQHSQTDELLSALLRVISFIGVAGVTAWFAIHLENQQQELRIISQFNESIVSNANVWLAVMDSTGKIFVWNKAAEAISGYEAGEVIGKKTIWKQLYPDPEYRKKTADTITTIISQKKIFENFETRIQAKNGEEKIISWNTRAVADEPAGQTRFVAIGIDVTARRRAEDALASSELRFRRTFETAKDGLLLIDKKSWEIIKVNPALAEILGYPAEELTGKKFVDIGLLKDAGDFEIARQKLAKYGFAFFPDIPLETRSGQHFDTEIYFVDRTPQVQCNVRDITDRRQAQKELIRKNEELQAAYEQVAAAEEVLKHNYEELSRNQQALSQARRKLSLLNSVTFEDIRDAILSLAGYIDIQKGFIQNETATGFIEKEKAIVNKIENNLDFAKNYQNLGINPPQWQNVNQVFLFAISHMAPLKVNRKINLDNLEIYADPLLEKVLFNIVENMTIHSVSATEFSVYFKESDYGLQLFLEDNGVGIPYGEKKNIFTRGYGKHHGMGLFLAQEILEITGICIQETGEPGKGARFEILIPKDKYRWSNA